MKPETLRNPIHFLALGFGTGLLPKAPGTFGTLAGVPIYLLLQELSLSFYIAATVAMFGVGVWLCGTTARNLNVHDHPAIVWDEIVGFLITMTLAPPGWIWLLVGFLLFRLFDIWKPWPINHMDERIGGGLGIMIDDGFAGVYAMFAMTLLTQVL